LTPSTDQITQQPKYAVFSHSNFVVKLESSYICGYLRLRPWNGGGLNSSFLTVLCTCVSCHLVAGSWNCNVGVWLTNIPKIYYGLNCLSRNCFIHLIIQVYEFRMTIEWCACFSYPWFMQCYQYLRLYSVTLYDD